MTRQEYLLDTDVCITIIRSKNDSLIRKVVAQELEQLSVSSITVAELEYGVAKSSNPEKNACALMQFLEPFRIRHFDEKAAFCYGKIRASLEKQGEQIGPLDTLIASQAVAEKLVMVTNNYREFRRIKELSIESWYEIDCSD